MKALLVIILLTVSSVAEAAYTYIYYTGPLGAHLSELPTSSGNLEVYAKSNGREYTARFEDPSAETLSAIAADPRATIVSYVTWLAYTTSSDFSKN